jgi:molybdopterin molybdotransferase
MKEFFNVTDLQQVLGYAAEFPRAGTEKIPLTDALGRVLAQDIVSDINLPDFTRATMDGYAVRAASVFGASEANPAYLTVKGTVRMGESPEFSIAPGECARISTGGMLPPGSDSVVMIEHSQVLDTALIEVYRSLAPGQHVIEAGEDIRKGERILFKGQGIRPQESGLLAAMGKERVEVYKKPVIAIVSTGDEVIPVSESPGPGQIRDINTYTLSDLVREAGAIPISFGIIRDNYDMLLKTCREALARSDMILVSGGSSVGVRDFTVEVIAALPDSGILVHGISISPGKPTILAKVGNKAFWGLPGHAVSAMVVFSVVVKPFVTHICGMDNRQKVFNIPARLSRNVSSSQGRTDYIRVKLVEKEGEFWAEPVLGKSGLIHTMVKSDGLIAIGLNTEGLDKGSEVSVIPF